MVNWYQRNSVDMKIFGHALLIAFSHTLIKGRATFKCTPISLSSYFTNIKKKIWVCLYCSKLSIRIQAHIIISREWLNSHYNLLNWFCSPWGIVNKNEKHCYWVITNKQFCALSMDARKDQEMSVHKKERKSPALYIWGAWQCHEKENHLWYCE